MSPSPHLVDARRLWAGEVLGSGVAAATALPGPLALIDLDATHDWPEALLLPPFPVIGIGDPAHPLAASLDAVVLPPVSASALTAAICARPLTAAVVTELLRLLPALAPAAGLVAESLAYATVQAGAEHAAWLAAQPPMSAAPPGALRQERHENTLTLTLDRAGAGNAIDRTMRDALFAGFQLAALDPTLARVRLRAVGKAFSLGAELGEFGTTRDPALAHAIRRQTLPAALIAHVADRLETHVQGACVGAGLEMAAWSARLTASPTAWFQLPELAMGVLPGAGGCVALTRRIGRQKTALLILSGRRLSARAALDWGLVDALVDQPPADESGAHIAG